MHGIDLVIVIVFLVGLPAFGFYFRRYVKSEEDYFLAGRMLPWWVVGFSVIGTQIGATDFVGESGAAYRFGIAQAHFEWIGALPAMVVSALLFIPYYWKAGVYTVPEFLGKRYNLAVRTILASLWIMWFVFFLGVLFWTSGIMLNEYLGLPIWLAIGITAIFVGLYTITGGLAAVAMTDVIQAVVMFIGGICLAVVGLYILGGWSALVDQVKATHPHHFDLFLPVEHGTYPWTGILFGLAFVMSPAWWCCNQAMIQRTLGARTEWDAKAGMIFAMIPKMCVPLITIIPGFIALSLNPSLTAENADKALPWLIKNLLPTGLAGLVYAAFVAALVSAVDSILNSTSTLLVRDIYQRLLVRNASSEHYLKVGRISTFVFIILAIILAPLTKLFPGIFVAGSSVLSVFQGPTFAITLLGIYWKRATAWGGLFSLLGGVALSSVLFFILHWKFLDIAWISFLSTVIINIVVSLLTKEEPVEKLQGLVYGLVMKNETGRSV
jgi:SSS family solute:Na+ symporter